jgi:non-heme chloroperoxidase
MPTITTRDNTEIYYKDWGTGQPIVFSHGWPLSADDWDGQMLFLGQHGYRVHRPRPAGSWALQPDVGR